MIGFNARSGFKIVNNIKVGGNVGCIIGVAVGTD